METQKKPAPTHLILAGYILCLVLTIAAFSIYSTVLPHSKGVIQVQPTVVSYGSNLRAFPPRSDQTIYIIMPTYRRANQRSLLTMLAHAFQHVKNFHWIISEDSNTLTPWLNDLMERFYFNFTHVACDRAAYCARRRRRCKGITAKGSVPRNCALMWLKYTDIKAGVIYFADDDNFYDTQLFEEIRNTRKVSVFPVGGFVTTGLSGPIVKDGKIIDFIDPWKADRKFPLDMAGFAVNVQYWRQRNCPLFRHIKGSLETRFLQDLNVTKSDLELTGAVSKVYVWHNTIREVKCDKASSLWKAAMKHKNTNLDVLKELIDC